MPDPISDPDSMSGQDDLPDKLQRLAQIARDHGLATLVLRSPATLSWLTGARSNVPHTLDAACYDVVIENASTQPSLRIVTNTIERPRLADTELGDLPAQWTAVAWWQDRARALPTGPDVGADTGLPGRVDVSMPVAKIRRALTALQRRRLRRLGADAATAMSSAAALVDPAMTEYRAAGLIAQQLLDRAMEPVCLFVAGGTRMGAHRHPLPTTRPLGPRASLVCCARRDGLIASVTRIVCLDPPTAADQSRYRALLQVEAAFLDATYANVRLGDAFAAGVASYPQCGFDHDEWTRHHQGGLSGWQPREFLAHSSSDVRVPEHAVVAWNPSAESWKVEDTCLVTADGVEPLVTDPHWPTVVVAGRPRPDLLIR